MLKTGEAPAPSCAGHGMAFAALPAFADFGQS